MLRSRTIKMRLINEDDAEFITELRSDEKYNTFLSKSDTSVEAQKEWIRSYKLKEEAEEQFYFIIERLDGTKCGTVRIYDIREDSFCWGSWILNQNKTRYAAIESAFLVYEFGFGKLGFNKCHFEVLKGNQRVVNFHEKFGAVVIEEDKDNLYFNISKNAVENCKKKFGGII